MDIWQVAIMLNLKNGLNLNWELNKQIYKYMKKELNLYTISVYQEDIKIMTLAEIAFDAESAIEQAKDAMFKENQFKRIFPIEFIASIQNVK